MNRDYYALEEQLKELASKRRALDMKAEMRFATLQEFERLKEQNNKKSARELEKQFHEAKLRNQRLLQHLNSTVDTLAACRDSKLQLVTGNGVLPPSTLALSERNLKAAIDNYQASVEAMVPVWKEEQTLLYEEKIKQISMEKRLTEERRQKILTHLEKEEQLKSILSSERQSLSMLQALEKLDVIEKQAMHAVRRESMNAAAESARRELEEASYALKGVYANARHIGAAHPAQPAPIPSPPPFIRTTASLDPYQRPYQEEEQFDQLQQLRAIEQQKKHFQEQLDILKGTQPAAREVVNHTVHNLPPTARDASLPLSVPSAVPPPKPAKRPSQTEAQMQTSDLLHPPIQNINNNSNSNSNRSSISEPESEAEHQQKLPSTVTAIPTAAPATASTSDASEGSGENHNHQQQLRAIEDLIPLRPPRAGSFLQQTPQQQSTEARTTSAVTPLKIDEPNLATVTEFASQISPPKSNSKIDKIMGLSKDIDSAFANSPANSDDEFNVSALPETQQQTLYANEANSSPKIPAGAGEGVGVLSITTAGSSFGFGNASEALEDFAVSPVAKLAMSARKADKPDHHSSTSSGVATTSNPVSASVAATAAATIGSAAAAPSSSSSLATTAMGSSSSSSSSVGSSSQSAADGTQLVTAGKNPIAVILAVKVLTNSIAKEFEAEVASNVISLYEKAARSVDRDKTKVYRQILSFAMEGQLNDVLSFGSVEISLAIFEIMREFGSYLMPAEALNGTVGEEKLKREHKRLGGGRQELWKSLMSHLRVIVQLKPNRTSNLATSITKGLVYFFDAADKDRLERKISTLINLAIIPQEGRDSSVSRSPSPAGRQERSAISTSPVALLGSSGLSPNSSRRSSPTQKPADSRDGHKDREREKERSIKDRTPSPKERMNSGRKSPSPKTKSLRGEPAVLTRSTSAQLASQSVPPSAAARATLSTMRTAPPALAKSASTPAVSELEESDEFDIPHTTGTSSRVTSSLLMRSSSASTMSASSSGATSSIGAGGAPGKYSYSSAALAQSQPTNIKKRFSDLKYGSLGISSSKAMELDDEELAEDDVILKPPPVRDLAPDDDEF